MGLVFIKGLKCLLDALDDLTAGQAQDLTDSVGRFLKVREPVSVQTGYSGYFGFTFVQREEVKAGRPSLYTV